MYHKKNLDFVALIWEDLVYQIDNKDSKKQDKMFYPRFTKIIIHHFLIKDKSISMRNRTFIHIARDDTLLGTMRFVSRHEDTQVYGALLPKAMTNQAMLDSVAYKTYYPIASGAETLKPKKIQKKSDSAISLEETSSKKKPAKAKKYVTLTKKPATKPKPTKKKALVKADKGKCLNVLSKVALSESAQLKKGFLMSNNARLLVQMKELVINQGFPMYLNMILKVRKNLGVIVMKKKDDDEDDTEDESDDDGDDDDDDGDNDDNDDNDDNIDDDDTNDDDDETDSDRTKSDRIKILGLNQSSTESNKEEDKMDEEEDI
ncbi:copia protein [Tanacetum coccineum]